MQAMVGVAFPIAEALLASKATSAGAGANLGWVFLAVVGVLHLSLFLLVISSDKPLSEFLVEFNDLTHALESARADCQASQLTSDTFQATADATMTSLAILNDYSSGLPTDLAGWLNDVLHPWVISRARIFWFSNTDDLYNFAVYRNEPDGILRKAWRSHDPRIAVTDREWSVGQGHVGVCFAQGHVLFSKDAASEDSVELVGTGRPDDKKYYRSMFSVPIEVKGGRWGVFIVTSSRPEQLNKSVHQIVIQTLAQIIALAVVRSEGNKNGSNNRKARK
jgi:hypothetical protein